MSSANLEEGLANDTDVQAKADFYALQSEHSSQAAKDLAKEQLRWHGHVSPEKRQEIQRLLDDSVKASEKSAKNLPD